jgi:hypothetical protein
MAKLTYLQLINRVLKRITQPEISTVTGVSGHAKIVGELINEAQNELWTEATNWHSLFTMRTFTTLVATHSTVEFANANPDYIQDTGNLFQVSSGIYLTTATQAGQTLVVSGSTSNDGVYIIGSLSSDKITLQSSDALTTATYGPSITIYIVTYPLASDFGRSHSLVDLTANRILTEDFTRAFDETDPNMDSSSDPTHFSIQGNYYRLFYLPSGVNKIVDRYWKYPTPLSTDSQTSDLPLFCENFLIHWAWMGILEYMNKFEQADRIKAKIYADKVGILYKAKSANAKIIDQMFRFSDSSGYAGILPPRLPSHYGRY